jgi:predicted  nucleic acid-binding Zn-ribbon protein
MQPNRLRLGQIAEYTSLAASVVGVVISTTSKQVVYAAAPLSVSLFLNLLNRQRFEQQTQQSLTTTAAQVERHLSQLNQDFSRLQQDVRNELNEQLQTLDARVTLSEQAQSNLPTAIAQVEQRLSQLTTNVSDDIQSIRQLLQSQVSVVNPATLQDIQQGLAQLQNRITAFESLNVEALPQTLSQLQGQYNSLLQSTSRLDQRLESFPSTGQVDSLQTEIEQLQTGLAQLQTNLQGELAQLQTELQALIEQSPSVLQAPETQDWLNDSSEVDDRSVDSLLNLTDDDIDFDEEDTQPELELLALNLGIDFGTSFTKVCFRDIGRERSEVITFTDGQADLDEALLPTKIGIMADGTLLAGLTTAEWEALEQPVQTSIVFIKMRLADLDISQESDRWRIERLPELDRPETVENLCAYYLSRVIARAQSWIRRNKPDLVKNQKIEWSANVGVPVEYCDSPAIARFKKVLSLAWLLSNEPQTELFTLESLGDRLNQLRSSLVHTSIDCHAIPEISAEVWSFLNSREADEGFYVFFDVGDGTLDGVSFRYWRDEGEPQVDFYSSSVKPLGVSALSQSIAAEINVPEAQVRRVIFHPKNSSLRQIHSTQSRKQIQRLVGKVVMEGRQKHGTHRPVFKDLIVQDGLNVFIGGGGGMTGFYQKAIMDTHTDFQHKSAGIPSYIKKNIPTPKDLSMSGLNHEFHRFAVAYGLSIPEGDCPEVKLPSEMEKAEPQELKTTSRSERLRYEDTRDSC